MNRILKDALYNLNPDASSDPLYSKGLVVGMVAGLMASGATYQQAIQLVKDNLPQKVNQKALPVAFTELFS